MGLAAENAVADEAQKLPLLSESAVSSTTLPLHKIPEDSFNLCYIIYFTLGAGFLLPWNAFITAVDYFDYLYPGVSVDRVFSVAYMFVCLVSLLVIVLFYAHRSDAYLRINLGLGLFVVALLVVPAMDLFYIKGQTQLYGGFYVTVGAVALCGLADALVQGCLIGSAGELPERYIQAIIAGTAASGVLVSFLRIFTKSVYSQNASGLRSSANLYFAVGIVLMVICIIFYNVAHKLPVIRFFNELKMQAVTLMKTRRNVLMPDPFGDPLCGRLWEESSGMDLELCLSIWLHCPFFLGTSLKSCIHNCSRIGTLFF